MEPPISVPCAIAPMPAVTADAVPTTASAPQPMTAPPTSWSREVAAAAYVRAVYSDLLGREPDRSAYGTWQAGLLTGTPRIAVANGITASREFRAHLVTDVYETYLGRGPEPSGLESWLTAMGAGATVAQIESGFVASDEFYARSGSTPAGWVTDLYTTVLGRAPATSEVQAWTRALADGADRRRVAMGFLLSTERLSTVVDGHYRHLLGRGIDPVGRAAWVGILQDGGRDEAIVGGIVASEEYWHLTGDAAHLEISPALATVAPGEQHAFTATAYDVAGAVIGDVTFRTRFAIDAGTCTGAACTATTVGLHEVEAASGGAAGSTALAVVPADLHHLALTTTTPTVASGTSATFTAQGFTADGRSLGDMTFATLFTADGAPCVGAVCSPTAVGARTVTGTARAATGPVTRTVMAAGPPGYRAFTFDFDAQDDIGMRIADPASIAQVGVDTHWADVDAAYDFTLGLKTDGTLWAWGDNTFDQLGTGGPSSSVPVQVGTERTWTAIDAGQTHSLALRSDGTLWAWGRNLSGQVGNGTTVRQATPAQVAPGTTWTSFAAGSDHSLAIRTDGSLWAWGGGRDGQLGIGNPMVVTSPQRVGQATWSSVSGGEWHSLGIQTDGSLWAWGEGTLGQVGDGAGVDRSAPVRLGADTWVTVEAGLYRSAAIRSDGTLWTWGQNAMGLLGDGTMTDRLRPVPVLAPAGAPWVNVHLDFHGVGVRADGTLWSWGTMGQEPWSPATPDRLGPRRVGTGTSWVDVTALSGSAVALAG